MSTSAAAARTASSTVGAVCTASASMARSSGMSRSRATITVGPARWASAMVDRAISGGSSPRRTKVVTVPIDRSVGLSVALPVGLSAGRCGAVSTTSSGAQLHTRASAIAPPTSRCPGTAVTTAATASARVVHAASAPAGRPRRCATRVSCPSVLRPRPDADGTWPPGRWSHRRAAGSCRGSPGATSCHR